MQRAESIIDRGQRAGVFRDDVPKNWLVTTAFSLMHAAADDCTAGRLDTGDAARVLTTTLLAAFHADRYVGAAGNRMTGRRNGHAMPGP